MGAGQRLRDGTVRPELGWGAGWGRMQDWGGGGLTSEPVWIIHRLWAATARVTGPGLQLGGLSGC